MKKLLVKIVTWGYHLLFKEEMTAKMKHFLLNLGYVTASSFIVAALMMVVQVVAGRFLGPSEYGKFALMLSIGTILTTLSMLGLHVSSIYYITKEERKSELISATLTSSLINAIIVAAIWFFFLNFWTGLFKISRPVAYYAGIFMFFNTFYHISRAFLRGLNKMKQFAIYDVISASLSVLAFFLLMAYTSDKSFVLAAISRILMFFVSFILIFFLLLPHLKRFNKTDLKHLYGYGLFAFYAAIGNLILGNADRVMLNYYKGTYDAGLYAAYFIASQAVVYQIYQSFLIIFFPTATQEEDKPGLLHKMNRMVIKLLVPIFIVNVLSTALFVWLFGKDYPFNWPLIILFSVYSLFYIIFQTYGWLLNTVGKKGARDNSLYILIGAASFIIMSLYAIPKWGIIGTISALTISNLILSIIMIKSASNCLLSYKPQPSASQTDPS